MQFQMFKSVHLPKGEKFRKKPEKHSWLFFFVPYLHPLELLHCKQGLLKQLGSMKEADLGIFCSIHKMTHAQIFI